MAHRLITFDTWAEAKAALWLLNVVWPDDDFFVGAVHGRPGLYDGTYETGGRALSVGDYELAVEAIAQ